MKNWIYSVRILIGVLLALVETVSMCEAYDITDYQEQNMEETIYVNSDELLITNQGMFLLRDGEALPLRAVFADTKGLYIKAALRTGKMYNECPNKHEIYHQDCGGCANWWCNFRCKCYSPWTSAN